MAKRKSKNYLVLGFKGLLKIFYIIFKYIGLGIYFAFVGIGYVLHKIATKIRPPKVPEAVQAEAKERKKPADTKKQVKNEISDDKTEDPELEQVHLSQYDELTPTSTVAGDYEDFMNSYLTKSQIALIFGKRGSGKSTLGFRVMENINAKLNRPCYVLGVKQSLLPSWIKEVSSVDEVANKGVVLVDEGAITFSARQSMKKDNVELGKLLAIARHKDITVLFITQNTGMIDKNVLNLTDIIIAKEGSLLQKKMERTGTKEFVEKADRALKMLPKEKRIAHAYVFSDDFEGVCNISLPSFWSERVSKSNA